MSADGSPATVEAKRPLAERMRPRRLEDFIGQEHLLGDGRPLRCAIEQQQLHSMVLWGPPGSGKTTLGHLFCTCCQTESHTLSAVLSGVRELRQIIDLAARRRAEGGRDTVLFIDEIHRFNKAQQDAFLPFLEDGTIYLIGATTENPSFELNNALLSRLQVYVLEALNEAQLQQVLERALRDAEFGLGRADLQLPPASRRSLLQAADGDARTALNLLELGAAQTPAGGCLQPEQLEGLAGAGKLRFDKRGDDFYNQISALHKAVRGSSPDAALYWFARMLNGGCDPLYIARRLVRMASEDIGNAEPRALGLALDAWDAQLRLGSPEGELAIAQVVVYLACLPKSNAVYQALKEANRDVQRFGSLEVPASLRNAPTRLARQLGHGRGYRYAHDEPGGYAANAEYLPPPLRGRRYYHPLQSGLEARIAVHLEELRRRDDEARKAGQGSA